MRDLHDTFKHDLLIIFEQPELAFESLLSFSQEGSVHLIRFNLGLSGHNSHRKKYHFIASSKCDFCNHKTETTSHFLLVCPQFAALRQIMLDQLRGLLPDHGQLLANLNSTRHQNLLTKIMIGGISNTPIDLKIFKIVATYIKGSERF